jgi:hypothetical protein
MAKKKKSETLEDILDRIEADIQSIRDKTSQDTDDFDDSDDESDDE